MHLRIARPLTMGPFLSKYLSYNYTFTVMQSYCSLPKQNENPLRCYVEDTVNTMEAAAGSSSALARTVREGGFVPEQMSNGCSLLLPSMVFVKPWQHHVSHLPYQGTHTATAPVYVHLSAYRIDKPQQQKLI